jgi:spermidine/putrescine transport system permease protein
MTQKVPVRFAIFVACVYMFLYIPIIVLVIFSFNKGEYPTHWLGFTTQWYYAIVSSYEAHDALYNSLIVALTSVFLSVTLGSLYVFYGAPAGLSRYMPFFYMPLAVPEIVLAAGLISALYVLHVSLGLATLVIAHTLLGLSYVIPIVYARYQALDSRLLEASYDLGATRAQTLQYVVLPFLLPSLVAASLLVFIVSFDDFILSFFCAGPAAQTLPVYLFALILAGATPMVNVISTLMIITSALLIGLCGWFQFGRKDYT